MLTEPAVAALRKEGGAGFVFSPAVRGIEQNEWRFGEATRIEFSAKNVTSGELIWFPRSNVSSVTLAERGVTIALRREMRYSGGAVWTVPDQVGAPPPGDDQAAAGSAGPDEGPSEEEAKQDLAAAPRGLPPGPRTKRPAELFSEPLALVLGTLGVVVALIVGGLIVARAWLHPAARSNAAPVSDSRLYSLTAEDNYRDVVRKLGTPERERALSGTGAELEQRALLYPSRDYAVVLMGVPGQSSYSQEPRFLGAIRLSDGAVVETISIGHSSDSGALLRIFARQLTGQGK
jgi:hypothetical protein